MITFHKIFTYLFLGGGGGGGKTYINHYHFKICELSLNIQNGGAEPVNGHGSIFDGF